MALHDFAKILQTIAQRRLLIFGVAGNVLETLLVKFVLHGRISPRRAVGALIVLAGVVLVGG